MTEQTYLQLDGAAVSPLPDYPGVISFPLGMTLAMLSQWQRFATERGGGDADNPRIGVVYTGDEPDATNRQMFLYDDVELALLFGTLDVTGPDGKKLTVKTKPDALPLPVAVWVAKCYREWEDSQLRFRWNGAQSVVAPVGP